MCVMCVMCVIYYQIGEYCSKTGFEVRKTTHIRFLMCVAYVCELGCSYMNFCAFFLSTVTIVQIMDNSEVQKNKKLIANVA